MANNLRELQSLSFISQGRNIILVGNYGVGKTDTAIGIAVREFMNNIFKLIIKKYLIV